MDIQETQDEKRKRLQLEVLEQEKAKNERGLKELVGCFIMLGGLFLAICVVIGILALIGSARMH